MTTRHTRIILPIALLSLALPPARPQQLAMPLPTLPEAATTSADPNPKLTEYDVASVKENKSGTRNMRITNTPDGFNCSNISLRNLIGIAYHIRQDLISGGPGWVDSAGFDIQAKVAAEDVAAYKRLSWQQRNVPLQKLLAERFHLTIQKETKVLPMYDLVVAKSGSKLKPLPPVAASPATDAAALLDRGKDTPTAKRRGMIPFGPGMFNAQGISLTELANNLSSIVQHTVADKTGLTGEYDIDLKWASEEPAMAGSNTGADRGVSIFTAVQEQLGLKLQSTKGPIETLVIEHAKFPSQN